MSITMRKGHKTMTELLRQALGKAESLRAVARATDTKHPSVVRFLRGLMEGQ